MQCNKHYAINTAINPDHFSNLSLMLQLWSKTVPNITGRYWFKNQPNMCYLSSPTMAAAPL